MKNTTFAVVVPLPPGLLCSGKSAQHGAATTQKTEQQWGQGPAAL